jgi:hypothetical protein
MDVFLQFRDEHWSQNSNSNFNLPASHEVFDEKACLVSERYLHTKQEKKVGKNQGDQID